MKGRTGGGKGFHLAALCPQINRLFNQLGASCYRSEFTVFERLPNRVRRGEVAALARNSEELQHTLIAQLCIHVHHHSPFEHAVLASTPSLTRCIQASNR